MLVSGGYGVATGGPLAWGLCYNHEMSPMQSYCDDYFKLTYPCTPGADYYGRGAIPIFWYVYVCLALDICIIEAYFPGFGIFSYFSLFDLIAL